MDKLNPESNYVGDKKSVLKLLRPWIKANNYMIKDFSGMPKNQLLAIYRANFEEVNKLLTK